MKQVIKGLIPAPLLPVAKWLYYSPIDTFDRLAGRRDALTPPKSLMFIGGGDFKRSGERFKGFFIELGHLRPEDRVLDVGCGVGRMAVPLTGYLSAKGSYEGFDIVPEAIAWCQRSITRRFSKFHFQVAGLYNKTYNPTGRYRAADYPFPYPDGAFDFVILTSVFTHLLPEDLDHYLDEIGRVCAPGARVFATFFLLNPESESAIAQGRSQHTFAYARGACRVDHDEIPEDAVAYPEDSVRERFLKRGFRIPGPVAYGKWCGREPWTSFQDIVVAVKS